MILATSLAFFATPVPDGQTVPLTHKSYRTWEIELPAERFVPLSGSFPFAHAGGEGFPVLLDGTRLLVDADGDGTCELAIDGLGENVKTAQVTLSSGGEPVASVRLRDEGRGWTYAASGVREGKIGATRVRLIDQNGNGRYDDWGQDAMIVGRGDRAFFLSKAIHVGAELYGIDVDSEGTELVARAFDGETGALDLAGGFDTEGKLLSAIVVSRDGSYSFDLGRAPEALQVPAGTYSFYRGELGLGEATVAIGKGRMEPIEVVAGASVAPEWGGPIEGEFNFSRIANKVVINPWEVWFYGAAGEEYLGFDPVGKSPEFTISEIEPGTEVAKALFPGSC